MSNNSGGIPKILKIGESEVNVFENPEILKLIESVRKEEKGKLYTTISELQEENKTLKTASNDTTIKEYQSKISLLETELEKLKTENKKPKMTPEEKGTEKPTQSGLTEQQVNEIVKKALEEQAKQYETKISDISSKLNTKTVSDYRKEQLAKHKGLIINDLVPESLDSNEAVDEAIKKALEVSKDYILKDYKDDKGNVTKVTLREFENMPKEPAPKQPTTGEEKKPKEPTPTYENGKGNSTPPPPPNTGGGVEGKSMLKDLDKMSLEEFNKNRDMIRAEIRKVNYKQEEEK